MELKLGIDTANLSPLKKNLLLALPPVIIIALFTFLFIMPALEERKALNEEIGKQKTEIASLERNSSRLPALKAENKRLEDRLSELQLQLPEEKEVSGLLKQVSELGIKSGLQVVSWRPGTRGVHPSKEVYEIPVEVVMRGTYHKFGQFFSNITTLNRIVNIFNISMRPGSFGLDVSFTSTTYSQIPEKEKKELQKKEVKK
ncbi:MAG: type 4a pilus biogenesis protein PilO [Nitrospirae bacterium]|nr:type 4a pilus biogenesis protein PilO [Nitrospirota bacterium]MCL5237945.1 type 4a pilus biogenesis protein PilO [Nitrospirota bacterium]